MIDLGGVPEDGPRVSVCMITYNHAAYIRQALDGVLAQETDFPVEIVVGEDCSTDRTRAVVAEYAARFPGRVRVLARDANLGMMRNFLDTYAHCRGEYVALLEGDDYWTDPRKLQQQVALLDADAGLVATHHDVLVVSDDGRKPVRYNGPFDRRRLSLRDLARGNRFHTCSVVFRAVALRELPVWYTALGVGDWPLMVLLAQFGDFAYIPKVMAHYRIHAAGVWSMASPVPKFRAYAHAAEQLNAHLGPRYDGHLLDVVLESEFTISRSATRRAERDAATARVRALARRLRDERGAPLAVRIKAALGAPGILGARAARRVIHGLHVRLAARFT